MKKKKVTSLTIPIDDVFASDVIVDMDNRVVYDTTAGYAIGYVTPHYDKVDVTIKPPAVVNREFYKLETNLESYLNSKHVVVRHHDIYYRVPGGYIVLGEIPASGRIMELSIPRIVPQADEDGSEE